ncbi:MAG: LuxR C-terminal-related transcriptional regulator [Aureispira sp.]
MKRINLVIIDKDTLLASLLVEYLEQTKLFEVILLFDKVEDFLEYVESDNPSPDILLFELIHQPHNGITLLHKFKNLEPIVKVIAYSSNYNLEHSAHVLTSGARAYCSKALAPRSLLEVIHHVFKYEHYWSPNQMRLISKLLPSSIPKHIYPIVDRLTEREKDILKLLAQQMTTKEIAKVLYISGKTVDSHKTKILDKTGARNSVGLTVFAIQNKIIGLDEIII